MYRVMLVGTAPSRSAPLAPRFPGTRAQTRVNADLDAGHVLGGGGRLVDAGAGEVLLDIGHGAAVVVADVLGDGGGLLAHGAGGAAAPADAIHAGRAGDVVLVAELGAHVGAEAHHHHQGGAEEGGSALGEAAAAERLAADVGGGGPVTGDVAWAAAVREAAEADVIEARGELLVTGLVGVEAALATLNGEATRLGNARP
mmetsp:Transcript_55935/g.177245  ORF Transcript_55935/g.177245 Transcript_55935/m.177245 type:complete len:200 (+) Transcript_55935:36-635(+)